MNVIETKKIWTTKDGRKIPIKDMSTAHIKKCICMMKNKGFIRMETFLFYLFGPEPNGDAASLAYEQEYSVVLNKIPSDYLDWLEEELKNRNETCSE